MNRKSDMVETFPLTVRNVIWDYTRIPGDASEVFYHYTSRAGLEGILTSGGLRATNRLNMNDEGELVYAIRIMYEVLEEVGQRRDLPSIVGSLAHWSRVNLDRILSEAIDNSSSYCACLSVSPDDESQWRRYADEGNGFAIGFNMHQILNAQGPRLKDGLPFLLCAPVTYEEGKQRDLPRRLVEAGIRDMQTFLAKCSQDSERLTALRDRVMKEIVVCIVTLIDFIKAPKYASEREMRLFLDPGDGTMKARDVQYYDRAGQSIPYIFLDLRSPITGWLPLAQIKVGPKASFPQALDFVEHLLDDLGYGSDCKDRPPIVQSSLVGLER